MVMFFVFTLVHGPFRFKEIEDFPVAEGHGYPLVGVGSATVKVRREATPLLCQNNPLAFGFSFLFFFEIFMPAGSPSKKQVTIWRFLATKKKCC